MDIVLLLQPHTTLAVLDNRKLSLHTAGATLDFRLHVPSAQGPHTCSFTQVWERSAPASSNKSGICALGVETRDVLQGPVKCITAASPFVASGGADDTVHLYNFQASIGSQHACAFAADGCLTTPRTQSRLGQLTCVLTQCCPFGRPTRIWAS